MLVPIVSVDEAYGLIVRHVQVKKAVDKKENTTVNIILEELDTFTDNRHPPRGDEQYHQPEPGYEPPFFPKGGVPDSRPQFPLASGIFPWFKPDETDTLAGRCSMAGGVIDNVVLLCFLEKIVDGKEPSLDQILQHYAEHGGQGHY